MHHDTLALAHLYARLVDDRCFEELHRVLAPDVRISGPGYTMESLPAVLAGMEVLRQYDRTFHLVANHYGDWESAERFVGETYCIASHVYRRDDGAEWKLDMAIRYQDCIVRRPEGLRFATRELRLAWTQDLPLVLTR
jgi:hypothetical protein